MSELPFGAFCRVGVSWMGIVVPSLRFRVGIVAVPETWCSRVVAVARVS